MKYPRAIIARLRQVIWTILKIDERFEEIKINQGIILSSLNEIKTSNKLGTYEFKVFSQWGEDGIIQHLTNSIEIKNKTFIEFGVEDFFESNCRFLMMKDDWSGFMIDGSKTNIERLKRSYFYWKHNLTALNAFITRDNINQLLAKSNFDEDIGILSIDLDGNDYYILEAIRFYKPRILICEYNPIFGHTRKISVPYRPDFRRAEAHHSNLYWGASLSAMTHIADLRGYALVGTNIASTNAFYVRKDLVNNKLEVLAVESAYSPSNYRESRGLDGELTHITASERLSVIKGLSIFDVEKNSIEVL